MEKKDLVILSPLTFVSGANSVSDSGAKPHFVDISDFDQNLDPVKVETELLKLKKKKKKVKAIIITDYAGNPANWIKFKKISKKFNLVLINDNCHAIGAKFKKKRNYACRYADYVIQSFHAVKNITCGEGGAIYVKSKKNYDLLKELREHGFKKKNWNYSLNKIGFNLRLSDINCALGISQLKRLNTIVYERNKLAKNYNQLLQEHNFIKVPKVLKHNYNSYHLYPIRIDFNKIKVKKNKFLLNLKKNYKINLQIHYTPTYKFEYYKKNLNISLKNFINTEKFYSETVSLPLFIGLKKKQQSYIVNSILKCLKKKN